MKLKLRDIVLDHHPAYVAIDYALGEALTEMVWDQAGTEELRNKELDIRLLIEGKEYDLKSFFQSLSDNYFKHLGETAKKILFKDAEDTISSLHSTLYEIESKLDSIKEDISYDMNVIDIDKLIGKENKNER
jgi:hypothetical protein